MGHNVVMKYGPNSEKQVPCTGVLINGVSLLYNYILHHDIVHTAQLTFRKYPAIHTNYIISHCTTLQYNHKKIICMTRYLGRNEMLSMKNNEINSAAIFPVWHELPMLRCGQINVARIRRRKET